jgi:hypothetical protein
MSMHANDWMAILMQKAMILVGMKAAGASNGDIKTAIVQSATQDLIAHLDTHPEVIAAKPMP